jgi:hypothetical protein
MSSQTGGHDIQELVDSVQLTAPLHRAKKGVWTQQRDSLMLLDGAAAMAPAAGCQISNLTGVNEARRHEVGRAVTGDGR